MVPVSSHQVWPTTNSPMLVQVSRDKLAHLGTCIGKMTHTGKFRLTIACLDLLAQHAKYKVTPIDGTAYLAVHERMCGKAFADTVACCLIFTDLVEPSCCFAVVRAQ